MGFTVFVVGAGASQPFGIPVGAALPAAIKSAIPVVANSQLDHLDAQGLQTERRTAVLEEMCIRLAQQDAPSVDVFLDTEGGKKYFDNGGMQALCHVLVEAERGAMRKLHGAAMDRDWLRWLWRNPLGEDGRHTPADWAIITFNYDRLIEYVIAMTLFAKHSMDWHSAWGHVATLPIVHVYGTLGPIGIPTDAATKKHWAEGTIHAIENRLYLYSPESVANAAWKREWIRLASARSNDVQAAQDLKAQAWLRRADRIVFLGFGFDPINMKHRLGFPDVLLDRTAVMPTVYATGFDFGVQDRKRAKELLGGDIDFAEPDKKCKELLAEMEW